MVIYARSIMRWRLILLKLRSASNMSRNIAKHFQKKNVLVSVQSKRFDISTKLSTTIHIHAIPVMQCCADPGRVYIWINVIHVDNTHSGSTIRKTECRLSELALQFHLSISTHAFLRNYGL